MYSNPGSAAGLRGSTSASFRLAQPSTFSRRTTYLLMMASALPSFFLGTLLALHASIGCHEKSFSSASAAGSRKASSLGHLWVENKKGRAAQSSSSSSLFPAEGFGKYIWGMARVDKEDFVKRIDPGVPLDEPRDGNSQVLVLYNSLGSVPSGHRETDSLNKDNQNPHLDAESALENCEILNVVLQHGTGGRKQCVAIVPQYESFHVQRWMRMPAGTPLRLVSRGQVESGYDRFRPPTRSNTLQYWDWLRNYLGSVDQVLDELRPILARIAVDNTVIVLVCNFGQSELLLNFICSCRSRGFDLSRRVILFATDVDTKELAEAHGITAYYDHRNFASAPKEAAGKYGDRNFVAMMFAKVICVQLVSSLGYNLLFQDVDVVWYKDPVRYFHGPEFKKKYDVIFQDDGGHSTRYAPYSANSGFYFAYANDRTRHFFSSMLGYGSLIISTHSHQQALIALLNEHVSLHGLRAKVVSRDSHDLPGGYQWNQKSGSYMRALFAGQIKPTIFHMSWTENKDNKLKFFQQMGEWWVHDQCVSKDRAGIWEAVGSQPDDLRPTCCSAEPLVTCHFRDKPSKVPCLDSPYIDKGKRKSFW